MANSVGVKGDLGLDYQFLINQIKESSSPKYVSDSLERLISNNQEWVEKILEGRVLDVEIEKFEKSDRFDDNAKLGLYYLLTGYVIKAQSYFERALNAKNGDELKTALRTVSPNILIAHNILKPSVFKTP